MCLYINVQQTKKHSYIKKNKQFKFYKTFEIGRSKLITINKRCEIPYTLDFIKSKGNIDLINLKNSFGVRIIEGGTIHAHIRRVSEFNFSYKQVQIPIIVNSDDIIAFGRNNDVCFFKYKIPKYSWDIINKKKINIFIFL
jgi:hypothetical protein